jgi:hypothetical protein
MMFISSTMYCVESTCMRSPTEKGCRTNRKTRDTNVSFAVVPKMKVAGRNQVEMMTWQKQG